METVWGGSCILGGTLRDRGHDTRRRRNTGWRPGWRGSLHKWSTWGGATLKTPGKRTWHEELLSQKISVLSPWRWLQHQLQRFTATLLTGFIAQQDRLTTNKQLGAMVTRERLHFDLCLTGERAGHAWTSNPGWDQIVHLYPSAKRLT